MEKKDIDKKIEDLRKEFNNKIDQLKEDYKNELKEKDKKEKSEKWIPKLDEDFYYLDSELNTFCTFFEDTDGDRKLLKYSKIFKTQKEAKEYADYLKARHEYSYEFSKEEWEDYKIEKYLMYYNYQSKKFRILCCSNCRDINAIYFKTRKKAQEFIENYKKQILKFEFGIEG